MNSLATIQGGASSVDLAILLRIKHSTLVYLANAGRARLYTSFEIKKRSGAARRISAPTELLKEVQDRIRALLSEAYHVPTQVHGFVPGRSALTNAQPHTARRWVLNIDLEDFFPSIHFGRVRGVLMAPPYSVAADVATILARLCCAGDKLPQGAPSSPIIANMVARSLDSKLRALAYKRRCTFSRYADDITFSGNSRFPPSGLARLVEGKFSCGDELSEAILAAGFKVNASKFRVQIGNMRKSVTGIVVNGQCNLQRTYVREIRAMLHAWAKFGYTAAATDFRKYHWHSASTHDVAPPDFARVVRGKIEYLAGIKGRNTDVVYKFYEKLFTLAPSPSLERRITALRALRFSMQDRLVQSTLVLECDRLNIQGTGFWVRGIEHMITCAHVVGENTRAYRPDDPSKTWLTETVAIDKKRDLALLRVIGASFDANQRLVSASAPAMNVGDQVTVAGFPKHSPGATLAMAFSQVTQFRQRERYLRIAVSSGIVSGMSGGPALNRDGQVVGVVATGAQTDGDIDSSETDYGFIPWAVVEAFAGNDF